MAKPFTLVQLRYFAAVAAAESMTAASRELNVTSRRFPLRSASWRRTSTSSSLSADGSGECG